MCLLSPENWGPSMGPGLPQGHLGYWRRLIAPQLGQSAGGLSQESSLHSNAGVWPGCWGSGLPLTQCCQNNPRDEMRWNEQDKTGEIAHIIKEQEKREEKTEEGQILCQVLDLLPLSYQPRFTVWNLWPLPIILVTDRSVKIWNKLQWLILVMSWV